jgi:glycosyltransferase involved in cell wall biosynthesis
MAQTLRILLLNDYGRPSGGAELQMIAIRDALNARGHAARLFASDAELVPGFDLAADRSCRGRTDRWQALQQTVNLSAWRTLRRELREYPPDVVHIRMFLWQLSPLVLQALCDVPVLFQAAVYKEICPNGMKLLGNGTVCTHRAGRVCLSEGCVRPLTWASTMTQLALVRRWRDRIDVASALSRRMADAFAADGWPGMRVIPNGVDTADMRPPLGPDPVVAYAGRLSREKGVATLIDAFAAAARSFGPARLLIAGTGPDEASLRQRAAAAGADIAFLGHLPRAEMERRFAAAWVQVVPSLWHEPFGNVTTEAMMRGTAVIASDVGGQSDIVRHGETGLRVPPGDAGALADALRALIQNQDRADALGRRGREVAIADYSRPAIMDRLVAGYHDAILRFRDRRGNVPERRSAPAVEARPGHDASFRG